MRLVPLFSAMCLFLAAVEYAIPKPLPFMRLGVANLPVMASLSVMRKRETMLLILFKVLAQSLITGTLFSYVALFSVAGSFASGLMMMLFFSLFHEKISNVGLSLSGSLANNAAQIALSYLIVFGEATRYIAPLLLTVGTISGVVMGIFANCFCRTSKWYQTITDDKPLDLPCGFGSDISKEVTATQLQSEAKNAALLQSSRLDVAGKNAAHAKIQFITALVLMVIFLLHKYLLSFVCEIFKITLTPYSSIAITWVLVAIFFTMTFIKKHGKIKILPSIFLTVFITLFALLSPSGRILFTFGTLRITEDALFIGLRKSATLVGMVFLSQFAISPRLELPGKVGKFLQEVFSIFDLLTAKKIQIKRGNIISALDKRLCEISFS